MKKRQNKAIFVTTILSILILTSSTSLAERIETTIQEWNYYGEEIALQIDADIPENIPATLPMISVTFHRYDADIISQKLVPSLRSVVNSDLQETVYGNGDLRTEYLRITESSGTLFYSSAYGDRFNELRYLDNARDDRSVYFRNESDLDGFSLNEALTIARNMIDLMGIDVDFDTLRHYTIDRGTFEMTMSALQNSSLGKDAKNVDYSPMETQHEGYFIVVDPVIDGHSYIDYQSKKALTMYVSRSGIELISMGSILDPVERGEESAILSPEEAIVALRKIDFSNPSSNFAYGFQQSYVIETMDLLYKFDRNNMRVFPVWSFDYLIGMTDDSTNWQNRTFDNEAYWGRIEINAYTGELVSITR